MAIYPRIIIYFLDMRGACLIQFIICSVGLDMDSFQCVRGIDYETRRAVLATQIVFEKLMCRCKG